MMSALKILRLTWGAALLSGCGSVQATDLDEAYRQALENDAQYAAVQAQRRAGNERLIQGRAGLLPQISLDAQSSWSETEYGVINEDIEQRRQNRSYGLQLVQPLFRWQNWIEYKHGGLQNTFTEIRFRNEGQLLILRVAQAYFKVLN